MQQSYISVQQQDNSELLLAQVYFV